MKRSEIAEAAAVLRRIADEIDAGELVAPAGMAERIAGAVVALEAVASGADMDAMVRRLRLDDHHTE